MVWGRRVVLACCRAASRVRPEGGNARARVGAGRARLHHGSVMRLGLCAARSLRPRDGCAGAVRVRAWGVGCHCDARAEWRRGSATPRRDAEANRMPTRDERAQSRGVPLRMGVSESATRKWEYGRRRGEGGLGTGVERRDDPHRWLSVSRSQRESALPDAAILLRRVDDARSVPGVVDPERRLVREGRKWEWPLPFPPWGRGGAMESCSPPAHVGASR